MNYSEAKAIVEALIFASPGPISQKRIGELMSLGSSNNRIHSKRHPG